MKEAQRLAALPKTASIYDSEGRLSGVVTKDPDGNISFKPRELTGQELVSKKAIESTRESLLQRLYKTPEEYTRAATEEAGAYAANAQRVAGEGFAKDVAKIGEVSNQRGLLGSSAWRDIMKSREKTQAETQAGIGLQATSMREGLIGAKKAQDYNLYNLYSGAANQYNQQAQQGLQGTQGLYGMQAGLDMQKYGIDKNYQLQQEQLQMQRDQANDPWRNYIMPAAQTAALFISDRRLKKDIVPLFKVGEVQFYEFEYDLSKWPEGVLQPQPGKSVGVMADEVRHIPDAVAPEMFYGYDMVNYEVIRRHLKMENA